MVELVYISIMIMMILMKRLIVMVTSISSLFSIIITIIDTDYGVLDMKLLGDITYYC